MEHEGRSRSQRTWRRLQVWQLPRKCERVAGIESLELMHGWENEEEKDAVESGVCFTCIHLALLGSAFSMDSNHILHDLCFYIVLSCSIIYVCLLLDTSTVWPIPHPDATPTSSSSESQESFDSCTLLAGIWWHQYITHPASAMVVLSSICRILTASSTPFCPSYYTPSQYQAQVHQTQRKKHTASPQTGILPRKQ